MRRRTAVWDFSRVGRRRRGEFDQWLNFAMNSSAPKAFTSIAFSGSERSASAQKASKLQADGYITYRITLFYYQKPRMLWTVVSKMLVTSTAKRSPDYSAAKTNVDTTPMNRLPSSSRVTCLIDHTFDHMPCSRFS